MAPSVTAAARQRASFTVRGLVRGHPLEITWEQGVGFTDPLSPAAAVVAAGSTVCATVMGPCFDAADKPGHVALLTALQVFDAVTEITGADAFVAKLRELSSVPEGAVS